MKVLPGDWRESQKIKALWTSYPSVAHKLQQIGSAASLYITDLPQQIAEDIRGLLHVLYPWSYKETTTGNSTVIFLHLFQALPSYSLIWLDISLQNMMLFSIHLSLLLSMWGSMFMRSINMKHVGALLHCSEVGFGRCCSGSSQMLVQALTFSSLPILPAFCTPHVCSTSSHRAVNNCIKSKQAEKGHLEEITILWHATTLRVARGREPLVQERWVLCCLKAHKRKQMLTPLFNLLLGSVQMLL